MSALRCLTLIVFLSPVCFGQTVKDNQVSSASDEAAAYAEDEYGGGAVETQLRVFQLQHARPSEVVRDLEDLVGRSSVIVAQDRINQIIVKGDRNSLDELEKLIELIDVRSQNTVTEEMLTEDFAFFGSNSATSQKEAAKMRAKIEALTAQNEALAETIRSRDSNARATEKKATSHPALRKQIEAEFDLRMSVQHSELELLQNRLRLIAARIKRRQALRSRIIDQRVKQLLSGNTTEKEGTRESPFGSDESPDDPFSDDQPITNALGGDAFANNDVTDAGAVKERPISNNAFTRVLPLNNNISVGSAVLGEVALSRPSTIREVETYLKLLRLELEQAELEADINAKSLTMVQARFGSGTGTGKELSEVQVEFSRAKLRVRKAKMLLELYEKYAEEMGAENATEHKDDAAAEDVVPGAATNAPANGNATESVGFTISTDTVTDLQMGTVAIRRTRDRSGEDPAELHEYGTIVSHKNRSYIVASNRLVGDSIVLKNDEIEIMSLKTGNVFFAQILHEDKSLGLCVLARIGNRAELSPNERSLLMATSPPAIGRQLFSLATERDISDFTVRHVRPKVGATDLTAMFALTDSDHEYELMATNLPAETSPSGLPLVVEEPRRGVRLVGVLTNHGYSDDNAVAHQVTALRHLLDDARIHDPYVDLPPEERPATPRVDLKLEL